VDAVLATRASGIVIANALRLLCWAD